MDVGSVYLSTRLGKIIAYIAITFVLTAIGDRLGFRGVGWQVFKGTIEKVVDELFPDLDQTKPQVVPADEIFWLTIRDSQAPALFEEFISKFPASKYVSYARARLAQINDAIPTQPINPKPSNPQPNNTQANRTLPSDAQKRFCVAVNGKAVCE